MSNPVKYKPFLMNQIMHYKDEQEGVNFVELLKNFEIN